MGCIEVSAGETSDLIYAKGERLLGEWFSDLEQAAQPKTSIRELIRSNSRTVSLTSQTSSASSPLDLFQGLEWQVASSIGERAN